MRVRFFDMDDMFGICINGRFDFRKVRVNQRFSRLGVDMEERGVEHPAKHRSECAASDSAPNVTVPAH
jgi:hypothetical protein